MAAAQLPGSAQQASEFQEAVAVDAGAGGKAHFIASDKFFHDAAAEVILEIKGIVRNAHAPGHASGILHVIQGAAGAFLLLAQNVVAEQPHGGADAVKARLLGKEGRNGAVNAAAHTDQCFFHHSSPNGLLKTAISCFIWSIATPGGKVKKTHPVTKICQKWNKKFFFGHYWGTNPVYKERIKNQRNKRVTKV